MSDPDQNVQRGHWMDEMLTKQLSTERDFDQQTPMRFQYAILCGHRTGSNLLSEALYETGMAGDPMEFFNLRMLRRLYRERNVETIPFPEYLAEMKARRTSPNGVFGFNLKYDQALVYFEGNSMEFYKLLFSCNYIVFLYRRSKIAQAVSMYIGQQRDMFRIPADADHVIVL